MKKFGILCVSFLLVLSLTGCGCSKKEEKTTEKKEEVKANTNENVIKDQTLEVFEFKNTSLVYENNNSKLETTVTNTGSQTEYLKEFKIHVKDKDGNEIIELTGFVGDNIEAGQSRVINSYYSQDLTNAESIEYEIIR